MHGLDICFVEVVMSQRSCKPAGLRSYFNAQVNHDTWHEHHIEDWLRIKFCGKVAIRQIGTRRFCLREQPVGIWVDQIPPRTTLAKSKGTCKVNLDQCATGLRGSYGVLVRKPTEIMAIHRLLT
eukprot:7740131-Pyramimonas_sp.AAC.1